MAKNRATVNISLEAKSQLDTVRSLGQSYDGIIKELVKFWKSKKSSNKWPEFREYARQKYPELDEDLITMIEDLIERRRAKRNSRR